ncbi:hypothetical protein [Burkholderia anthina]|uniref:hypothetical protein n=1 Tax=Burkholderia anthina TaxID=179879 RepID=UPI00158DA28C|nr:hypothetical protein [Burkholderia anthina]
MGALILQLDLYLSRYAPANSFMLFVVLSKNDGSLGCAVPDAVGHRVAVVALHQARNQVTAACCAMAVSGNRNVVVLHRFVAFLDDVR